MNNATLLYEYYNIRGEKIQVYSVRLKQNVSAKELKRSLELATAVNTRTIIIKREGMYLVFFERSALLSFQVNLYDAYYVALTIHM